MADLVRIFAADKGTTTGDISFAGAAPFPDVILEVEASDAEFSGSQAYRIGGFARDYSTGKVAALAPGTGVKATGSLNTTDWPKRNQQFVFTLPATVTGAAAAGGIVELVGIVSVGAKKAGADADIATSAFT